MEFNATFIVAFISFTIFTVIMNLILYKPIDKVVSERQNFINDNYDVAKLNSDKSKSLQEEKEEKITQAKNNARNIFSENADKAKIKKEKEIQDVKIEALNELKQKRTELENAKKEINDSLNNEIVNLAQMISDKFLQAKEEIDNNLIEETIKG